MTTKIRTGYRKTVSMSMYHGDAFADCGTYLEVFDFRGNYLGFISVDYFRENRYRRMSKDGIPVWVCPFIRE